MNPMGGGMMNQMGGGGMMGGGMMGAKSSATGYIFVEVYVSRFYV
jgi:hypothetical protein